MSASEPKLISFAISHFCEKARWALEWHGIAYTETRWAPGPHIVLARRLGVPATTLPILIDHGRPLQGSGVIVDWADARDPRPERSLTPPAAEAEARAIEHRADDAIGVQIRRLIYAETLTHHPEAVRPGLFEGAPPLQRRIGGALWPVLRRLTIKVLHAAPEDAADARARMEVELDWVDGLLSDGRRFLVGDRLGRADIAVASLLAPLSRPPEHPLYAALPLPPALLRDVERWHARPTMRWALGLYRELRHQPAPRPLMPVGAEVTGKQE
jgi:glutathione S-transferase